MTRVAPAPVLLLLFAVAAGSGCGGDVPTSILLTISAESGVGEIDGIALDIFDDAGIAVSAHRVAADAGASISLPATIVLYPPRPGMLRLRALGSQQGTPRGEGVLQIVARAGEQVEATLALQIGRLADRDGDGVPDAVDNCPDVPNPRQRPCAGEAGSEGGADADAAADGPRDSGDAGDATADGVAPDTTGDATTDLPPCACPLGCKPASASCRRLVPSGGFTAGSYRTLGPINSSATIDTDACSGLGISGAVQSRGGATVCVLSVTRLQINNNVVVSVHGSRALVLLVDGDVDIRGVLDLGGKGATPGPGGFAGGVTPTGGPAMAGAGPGGGGVCSCPAGGIGGDDCGGAGGSFG
ncbi:MAG: thrombospondin type 3 repeat-containing protein, partial [Myxococcales bacterium]|nr:thrombospondin type 3 repeat-containing protein [Myxococcales bacterium]